MTRACVALIACALITCSAEDAPEEQPPIRVRCAPVEARSIADVRTIRGTVVPAPEHHAIVSAEVPGRLDRVAARVGDRVREGAVIAEIEPRVSRDTVTEARAAVAQAVATESAATSAATREAHLVERGIHARQSLEAADAERARTEAAVAAARAQLDAARHGVERTVVTAPIDGVIVHVFRGRGDVVDGTPMTPIVELADPSALELDASAAPAELVALAAGQSATARFDVLPDRTFAATVRAVSPAIDPATGVGQVWLTLACDDVCPPLGLLGLAEVRTGEPRASAVVPEVAVRNGGGARTEVVVCADHRAHVVEVTVGRREDGVAEITSGVAAGARVAIDEVPALEDGAPIEETR